jgi:hypothetical protein
VFAASQHRASLSSPFAIDRAIGRMCTAGESFRFVIVRDPTMRDDLARRGVNGWASRDALSGPLTPLSAGTQLIWGI